MPENIKTKHLHVIHGLNLRKPAIVVKKSHIIINNACSKIEQLKAMWLNYWQQIESADIINLKRSELILKFGSKNFTFHGVVYS